MPQQEPIVAMPGDATPAADVPSVLTEVTRPRLAHGIRYMLVGALAVIFHGAARSTRDLDIRVDLGGRDIPDIANALRELPYPLEGPDRNEFGLRFLLAHPSYPVEFYLSGADAYTRQEFDRAQPVRYGTGSHLVISKEDLVLRKLFNMTVRRSPTDKSDIEAILSANWDSMDTTYIESNASRFRTAALFRSLRADVARQMENLR